jgi:hypothetical protein
MLIVARTGMDTLLRAVLFQFLVASLNFFEVDDKKSYQILTSYAKKSEVFVL